MNKFNNEDSKNFRPEPAPGVLYVVGTPIGNIGDFTPRAESLLRKVSVIACEDTRKSGLFLKSFDIKTSLISFHAHNTKSRIPQIISLLKNKKSVALISDAGLPIISDPGEELISSLRNHNYEVICIPGPCAATTALVCSGLPSKRFCFEGFLPRKARERLQLLNQIAKEKRTTIIYESPHRLNRLLKELEVVFGNNHKLQISRELTKRFEEQIGPTIKSAIEHFEKIKPQGEFTIIIAGSNQQGSNNAISNEELKESISKMISNGESTSSAIKKIAKENGVSRRLLYSMIHQKK